MGQRRRLHAFALVVLGVAIAVPAVGQRGPRTPARPGSASNARVASGSGAAPAGSAVAAGSGSGSGSGSGPPPKPAGASPIESTDIPAWQAGPPRFAVAPFENQSSNHAYDWLVAGLPFEIAEKTEEVLGLEPTGGSLYVGASPVAQEGDAVLAFAQQRDVPWVITGFADAPASHLRVSITLWRVAGRTAVVEAEAARTGEQKQYHQMLGEALGEVWSKAGIPVDLARAARLQRPLASDVYAVTLWARGLGYMTGALGGVNLKAAEHDLERAVFIDPKCPEAQRLLGELYMLEAPGDPKAASKATGKFNYANDLRPDDIASLRASALGAARGGKFELAKELFARLVTRRPWDLEARYELGNAMWRTGDGAAAEKQLEQVTAHKPNHLAARRVLVLIHSTRNETDKLVRELEAIAKQAPNDLDVKADLATAYGAQEHWDKATAELEAIAAARVPDMALTMRIGDAHKRQKDVDGAVTWYAKAARLEPGLSYPAFATAQAYLDAGKLAEATRWYTFAQKFKEDLPAAEEALGALALLQNRADDAAWYLRRAVREAPRVLAGWRAEIAAELRRRDAKYALLVLDRALTAWPNDVELRYMLGVAYAMTDERATAQAILDKLAKVAPTHAPTRAALDALASNTAVTLTFTPEIVRPWGDASAIDAALDRYAAIAKQMAAARSNYQKQFVTLLGVLGKGPEAPPKPPQWGRTCPVTRLAPAWAAAQQEMWRYIVLGQELEGAYRFVARHDEVGATQGLLPNERAMVASAKKGFRTALADTNELRAEWARGLVPELALVNCSDKLLQAAVNDPEHYRVIEEDHPDALPTQQAPRPKPRATFYIDNAQCPDAVEVWIDGVLLGQVAPGRRSALVADGGERTLCLIVPGAAQCGDKGTARQVYLHDGWAATMHCLK